jgi:hypothetical protein
VSRDVRRFAKRGFEVTNAKAGQKTFHAVYNAGTFANKAFTLAVRPFGILFFKARDLDHTAMIRFPAQPADESSLEQLGVQPVSLRPPMLT